MVISNIKALNIVYVSLNNAEPIILRLCHRRRVLGAGGARTLPEILQGGLSPCGNFAGLNCCNPETLDVAKNESIHT